jgi:ATP-dependent DNA helicase RecG
METADFTAQTLDIGSEGFDRNEIEKLKEFIKKKTPGSILLTQPEEEMLLTLGVLKRTKDSIRTTIAGLILLGQERVLRDVLPSAEVVYLHMTDETEYDKRIDCAQPLLSLLTTLTAAIQEYNRILTVKIGLFDLEIPDFPLEVFREALINGLIHRDYGLLSPSYVRHYSNRLEISSPGGFFGGVTTENILTHDPITRNPLLNLILHRIGLVEKAGIGIKRMLTTLLSLGKEPLQFETKEPFIQVIIRDGNVDELFAAYVMQRTKEGKGFGLPELLVLSYLKRNREIEIRTVSQLLQRPDYKTKEILSSMIELGLLEPFGQTKGTVYRLSKKTFTQLRKSVEYRLHRRAEAAYAETLIIDYLKENGYITNEICRTLLRINRSQAQYLLARLVEKRKLTQPAKGRNARYFRRHS